MTELATLGLSIRSDGVVVATDRLKDFEGAGRRAEDVAGSLARMATRVGTALAGAFSIAVLQNYADAWSDMQSRVGASIRNMEAAPALMQRIVDIANASYSPLEQTVEIFGRNVVVLRALGRSAADAADFTEALNHAMVTTATKGQDADVVLNALSRSIATGRLRAMEFETIMSRSPRVLEAIADEMGTNITSLRSLAQEGKVTGQVITDALINSLERLREEAGEMPATIGDAFTRIRTNTIALVGTLDQAWGISGRVAEQMLEMADGIRNSADTYLRLGNILIAVVGPAFDFLAGNIEIVGRVGAVAGAALLGFFATPTLVAGIVAATTALVSGFIPALGAVVAGIKAIGLAMLANPLGILIGGLAAAVTAAFMFRDEIKQAIGVDVVQVFRDGANLIIGAMVGTVRAVQVAWEVFPDFMEGIGARAWNSFLSGFEGPAVRWTNPLTGEMHDLLNIDLSSFRKDEGGVGGAAVDSVVAAYQDAQRDYVTDLENGLQRVWSSAEGTTNAMLNLADAVGGGSGASTGSGSATDAYGSLTKSIRDNIAALEDEGKALGMTDFQATKFTTAQELLRAAMEAKRPITTALMDEINSLAIAYADAELAIAGTELALSQRGPFEVMTAELANLEEMLQRGAINWQTYGNAATQSMAGAATAALGLAGQATGALAQMFQDNKAFAVANAVVSTAEAIMKAMATYGPTPWGFAAAGVAAATGAAQIAAIMSAQKGSASTPNVGGGAAAAAQPAASGGTGRAINVTLQGSSFSASDIEDLVEQLNDFLGDNPNAIKINRAA